MIFAGVFFDDDVFLAGFLIALVLGYFFTGFAADLDFKLLFAIFGIPMDTKSITHS